MNRTLTSQPVVILTGAGASKWLGKATTYDVYDTREFSRKASTSPFKWLRELRDALLKDRPDEPIDLELLLDEVLKVNAEFDHVFTNPHYQGYRKNTGDVRSQYEEAYEQALDFLVEYFGDVDRDKASELWLPFLTGLSELFGTSGGVKSVIPLFTLNYDEAIEFAVGATEGEFELVDGFRRTYPEVWSAGVFDSLDTTDDARKRVALLKLHGSVAWTRRMGSDAIEKTVYMPRQRRGRDHVVLYPTALEKKELNTDPFATAYGYFQEALAAARVAVFIGTSFRDKELRDAIRNRIAKGPPMTLLSMNPKENALTISDKIGTKNLHIRAIEKSFEPANVGALIDEIRQALADRT